MIVFVLIMLPTPRSTRSDTLLPDKTPFLSAAGYGFKGVKLGGNDPVAFYKGMKEVIDEIRAGKGPIFLEATTYRLGPHAGVGDYLNAPQDELQAGKEAWPVPRVRAPLLESGIFTEAQLAEIEAAARRGVEAAMAKAMDDRHSTS